MRLGDERHQQRREQVLQAARSCLAEHGLEAVSMEMITVRAGLSTGTVYRYFAGKQDILASAVLAGIEEFLTAVQPLLDEEPATAQSAAAFIAQVLTAAGQPDWPGAEVDLRRLVVHGWSHSRIDPHLSRRVRDRYTEIRQRFTRVFAGRPNPPPGDRATEPAELAQLLTSITLGFLAQRALIEDTDVSAHRAALACLAGPEA